MLSTEAMTGTLESDCEATTGTVTTRESSEEDCDVFEKSVLLGLSEIANGGN